MKHTRFSPALRQAARLGCLVAYKIVYKEGEDTGAFEKCTCSVCTKL